MQKRKNIDMLRFYGGDVREADRFFLFGTNI